MLYEALASGRIRPEELKGTGVFLSAEKTPVPFSSSTKAARDAAFDTWKQAPTDLDNARDDLKTKRTNRNVLDDDRDAKKDILRDKVVELEDCLKEKEAME